MLSLATAYFSDMFTSKGIGDPGFIFVGIDPCISDSMNDELDKDFTCEDVCLALKSMHSLKVSGEDGLGAVFYQRFWHIVGKEIVKFWENTILQRYTELELF